MNRLVEQTLKKPINKSCKSLLVAVGIMSLNLLASVQAQGIASRGPASMEEEVLTVPMSKSFFSNETIFAEDDSGVMASIKYDVKEWEKREEFAEIWDLKGIEFYEPVSEDDKKAYLGKKMLRYLDRRLSGEMKKAENGSTLHTIKTVEKNLRPDATVAIAKNFSVKFKARVLQGKVIVDFRNPWIEANTVISVNGKAKLITKKEFKELSIVTGAEYSVTESEMLAYVDHQFTKNIKGRISSTQENGVNIFGGDTDARVEVSATFPFNM